MCRLLCLRLAGVIIKVLRSSVLSRKPALCHYELYGKGFIENGLEEYDNEGYTYFEDQDEISKPMTCSSSILTLPKKLYWVDMVHRNIILYEILSGQ